MSRQDAVADRGGRHRGGGARRASFSRGLNFGVEFTGGRLVEFATAQPLSADKARQAVAQAGLPQRGGADRPATAISVRAGALTIAEVAKIEAALDEQAGEVTKQRDEFIGPSLGDELRRNALIALAVALAAQLAYLAFRFRWTFGAAAVLAMLHGRLRRDRPVRLARQADRRRLPRRDADRHRLLGQRQGGGVRPGPRAVGGRGARRRFPRRSNGAILQTMPRTVNTGLGALFILAALAVFGGDSLRDFAIALLAGSWSAPCRRRSWRGRWRSCSADSTGSRPPSRPSRGPSGRARARAPSCDQVLRGRDHQVTPPCVPRHDAGTAKRSWFSWAV